MHLPHADGRGISGPVRDGILVGEIVVIVAALKGARNWRRFWEKPRPVCYQQREVAGRPDEGDRPRSPTRRVGIRVCQVDHQSTDGVKFLREEEGRNVRGGAGVSCTANRRGFI